MSDETKEFISGEQVFASDPLTGDLPAGKSAVRIFVGKIDGVYYCRKFGHKQGILEGYATCDKLDAPPDAPPSDNHFVKPGPAREKLAELDGADYEPLNQEFSPGEIVRVSVRVGGAKADTSGRHTQKFVVKYNNIYYCERDDGNQGVLIGWKHCVKSSAEHPYYFRRKKGGTK